MIFDLFNQLPTLKKHKSENWAAVIGLLFGGIGLAIYFKSIVDLLFLVVVAVVLITAGHEFGWVIGALLSSTYGWFRAHKSNQDLAGKLSPAP